MRRGGRRRPGVVRDRPSAAVRAAHGRRRRRAATRSSSGSASCTPSTRASFPSETKEKAYLERLRSCYPIHPELFDRLFDDWSTLERFQRTRGVLKLMAAVVHALWERQDGNLLILPGRGPARRHRGPAAADAVPRRQLAADHRERRRRDRVAAAAARPRERRDVRAVLGRPSGGADGLPRLGAAAGRGEPRHRRQADPPGLGPARRDAGDVRRRAAQARRPGDLPVRERRPLLVRDAAVGQPARPRPGRAAGRPTGSRWRSSGGSRSRSPTAARSPASTRRRSRARTCPTRTRSRSSRSGPSTRTTPRPRRRKAIAAAGEILASRGAGARTNQNMLVFLAADHLRLAELTQAVREYLAWSSIVDDGEAGRLNLDALPAQPGEVAARRRRRDRPRPDPRDLPVAPRAAAGRPAREGRAAPGQGVGHRTRSRSAPAPSSATRSTSSRSSAA